MVSIYALKCKENKYYIGKTNNCSFRLKDHFVQNGSTWTKKYKPIKIISIVHNRPDSDEQIITQEYMSKYGIDNVRGGPWTKHIISEDEKNIINKIIDSNLDKCYNCGENGHFAKDCNYCSDSDEEDDLDNLKIDFIELCKSYDRTNNGTISAKNICNILSELNIDLKLTNVYGICQTINCCNLDFYLDNYRKCINYEYFIEGFIYILENNPQICDLCNEEKTMCNCRTKTKYCKRCGRNNHFSNNCFASTHIKGYLL